MVSPRHTQHTRKSFTFKQTIYNAVNILPKIKTLTFLLLLLSSIYAHAQSPATDEVKRLMENASKAADEDEYLILMKRADSTARRAGDMGLQAKVNQQLGHHYYSIDADESIKHSQKAHSQFTAAGNKRQATMCLQTIAFAYDEEKKDYENAMKFTKRAITAHTELNDTLQMANMYKYQCYLYGKLHNFKEGKKSADKAKQLYNAKNYRPGLAVTYRDLAILYEEEKLIDSSIAFMKMALDIWNTPELKSDNGSRIFGINSDLIRIYAKAKQPEDAEFMIYQNEQADASKLYDVELLKFYKEAKDFLAKNKDKEKVKLYREKYSEQREKMKADGKQVD